MNRDYALKRRAAITRAYLSGVPVDEIASRVGITPQSVKVNLSRWGVRLPDAERKRRFAESARRLGKANAVWPECPEHLRADYETLRRYMSAREARAKLEAAL